MQVDVRIESTDPSATRTIESALQHVNPSKLEQHRDLMTVITVASSAASLVKSFIDLWKELKNLRGAPAVKLETEAGAELDLSAATSETEIETFVTTNAAGK